MTTENNVRKVLNRLTPLGWHQRFLQQGIDILSTDLPAELQKKVTVNREMPGMEDFSLTGCRGIEPGKPALSLLYHMLASPGVNSADSAWPVTGYPTAAEMETILDYVYSTCHVTLEEIIAQAAGAPLAVVVYSTEYRTGAYTPHKKHADLCFSRTGISRVGTAEARYDGELRGYTSLAEQSDQVRVTPARYSAYIAAKMKGSKALLGEHVQEGDEEHDFWVPLHKLFNGSDCVEGMDIIVTYHHFHSSEKIRQFHIRQYGIDPDDPACQLPPYKITEGLAEFALSEESGPGLLVPVPRDRLIDIAVNEQGIVSFVVPEKKELNSYIIHRRFQVNDDGSITDLNLQQDVQQITETGGYTAAHLTDYTADGWVSVACDALNEHLPETIAAYSIIAAPDFYPSYTQAELLAWSKQQSLPSPFFGQSVRALSDLRTSGNIALFGSQFSREDKSITALITCPTDAPPSTAAGGLPVRRATWLSDGAAGTLSPGWDIAGENFSSITRPEYLCHYNLGSPFTEDIRLCASIGGYWPAVSPDTSRTFAPENTNTGWIPVIPLTDKEGGQQDGPGWDGVRGPRLVEGEPVTVEYDAFQYCDYTKNLIEGHFSFGEITRTSATGYQDRIISMHRAFMAVNAASRQDKAAWSVLSFTIPDRHDGCLIQAQEETGQVLDGIIHHYILFRNDRGSTHTVENDFTKQRTAVLERVELFISPHTMLLKTNEGPWNARENA
ncbi:hypothetical protein L8P35_17765 [Enterobacter cloacae]|uniref:hypothetical protein n=1 Tax=Enterobacter cloacae TaxID=550 RepID=UPI00200550EE|nr:hypothetical protein [Enterobacter cloacae]MCK7318536.1 hypothetical protein [Enterobacter cloacae]